ncbi:hypothetical protein AB0425_35315 [Actinosynnema sp. NPDC051121]
MSVELLAVCISAGAGIMAAVINAVGRIVAARLETSRNSAQASSEE